MSILTATDRVLCAAKWPFISMQLLKQTGTTGKSMKELGAMPPGIAGVLTLLMGGDVPLESLVLFYVVAGGISAFLDKIVGMLSTNKFAVPVVQAIMKCVAEPSSDGCGGSSADVAFNVAGPTTAHPLNTANSAQSKFALPRYPFISGQQYALHNDGGTTWATTKQAVHGGF